MRWSTSPRRKRISPGLSSVLSVTNAIFASLIWTRSVQIPCRNFSQVVEFRFLCRTRAVIIKILCLLLPVIYDVIVIPAKPSAPGSPRTGPRSWGGEWRDLHSHPELHPHSRCVILSCEAAKNPGDASIPDAVASFSQHPPPRPSRRPQRARPTTDHWGLTTDN